MSMGERTTGQWAENEEPMISGGLVRPGLSGTGCRLLLLFLRRVLVAQPALPAALRDVGIDQKLDAQVPPDLVFRDETGEAGQAGGLLRQQADCSLAGLLRLPHAMHPGAERVGR